jgi:pheromone shutdown protein TraB
MDEVKSQIRIVGTSHIAKQSEREIQVAYDSFQPDIIAIELDRRRLQSLLAKDQDQRLPLSMIKQIGVTGYLFAVIGKAAQKKMGNIVNVNPGVDLLAAVELAKKHEKQLHLVDQDILITMKHLSKQFSFREKMRVVGDVILAPFQKKIKFDFRKIPEKKVIKELIGLLKDRYPSLYNVLIVERNIIMAKHLDAIVRKNPGKRILLVIGAGHEEDLRLRLKNMERIAEIL